MTRELFICERKAHLPEHDGATGYFYYEPVRPYSEMRTWKEVRNENYTQSEIDAAYEAVIDELKGLLELAEKALCRIDQKSPWIASKLDLYPDDLAEAFEEVNKAAFAIHTYKGSKP
jgi:hypothetical protein